VFRKKTSLKGRGEGGVREATAVPHDASENRGFTDEGAPSAVG